MLSPRDPVIGGMVRTSGRMTPGGMRPDRRWSESAIPRVGHRRPRRIGTPPPPPLYVEASYASRSFDASASGGENPYAEGYFKLRLESPDSSWTAYSEMVPLADAIPAHTRIRFTFDPGELGSVTSWDYAEVVFYQGDGSSRSEMYDGAYGFDPVDWSGSLVGVTPPPYGRLVDPGGLITP